MLLRTAILGLLLGVAPLVLAGDVLDRVVATVNGHVILQSDWQDEVSYESFEAGRAPESVTPQDRKAALDRLTDQELLREQATGGDVKETSADEVEKQLVGMKGDFAQGHPARSWNETLASYGLTESDIKEHIASEIFQLRLVDAHLRPSIQVDPSAIEQYYKDHLAALAAGGQQISLQQATPKIRELLTQEQINQSLTSWLESLRSQAQVRMFVSESADGQGPVQ